MKVMNNLKKIAQMRTTMNLKIHYKIMKIEPNKEDRASKIERMKELWN